MNHFGQLAHYNHEEGKRYNNQHSNSNSLSLYTRNLVFFINYSF